jgi:D-amino-acid oxidase
VTQTNASQPDGIQADTDVLVIGAGIMGLSTAICLAEAGVNVAIAAAEPPQQTTSIAAGALWGPHLVGMDDRVARWASVTQARFTELSAPELGANALAGIVRTAAGIAASREHRTEPPEFAAAADLAECAPADIPAGYSSAWRLRAPIVAMPGYLDYLAERFGRAGGTTPFPAKLAKLSDARVLAPSARVIVNCTGCGARELVPDPDVTPVRGQVVVTSNPGLTEFFVGTAADPDDLTYLFPHGDVVVLGGTEQPGNWSREPDPAIADRILAACVALQPALAQATVLAHRVGLRPTRPTVRLETEPGDGVTIVHNYGHGGAGVTLAWGCAEDAAALALGALGAIA